MNFSVQLSVMYHSRVESSLLRKCNENFNGTYSMNDNSGEYSTLCSHLLLQGKPFKKLIYTNENALLHC